MSILVSHANLYKFMLVYDNLKSRDWLGYLKHIPKDIEIVSLIFTSPTRRLIPRQCGISLSPFSSNLSVSSCFLKAEIQVTSLCINQRVLVSLMGF